MSVAREYLLAFSSAKRETALRSTAETAFVRHLHAGENAGRMPDNEGIGIREWGIRQPQRRERDGGWDRLRPFSVPVPFPAAVVALFPDPIRDSHLVSHHPHSLTRDLAAAFRPAGQRVIDERRLGVQLVRTLLNGDELLDHVLVQHPFAVDTPPASRTALNRDVLDCGRRAERLVQVIDVAHLGRAGVGTLDAL